MKFIRRSSRKPENDDQERKAQDLEVRQRKAVARLEVMEAASRVYRRRLE